MATFLIGYDLHYERNYRTLIAERENKGAVRILESTSLHDQQTTAEQLRDAVASYVDGDGSVIVLELKPGADWATLRVPATASDWLRARVIA